MKHLTPFYIRAARQAYLFVWRRSLKNKEHPKNEKTEKNVKVSRNMSDTAYTTWKVFVFGVFLVHIFRIEYAYQNSKFKIFRDRSHMTSARRRRARGVLHRF